MNNTFTQKDDGSSKKERINALKMVFLKRCAQHNIFERWKDNSSMTSIGCDFDASINM